MKLKDSKQIAWIERGVNEIYLNWWN
jgi:hypothetical protein